MADLRGVSALNNRMLQTTSMGATRGLAMQPGKSLPCDGTLLSASSWDEMGRIASAPAGNELRTKDVVVDIRDAPMQSSFFPEQTPQTQAESRLPRRRVCGAVGRRAFARQLKPEPPQPYLCGELERPEREKRKSVCRECFSALARRPTREAARSLSAS